MIGRNVGVVLFSDGFHTPREITLRLIQPRFHALRSALRIPIPAQSLLLVAAPLLHKLVRRKHDAREKEPIEKLPFFQIRVHKHSERVQSVYDYIRIHRIHRVQEILPYLLRLLVRFHFKQTFFHVEVHRVASSAPTSNNAVVLVVIATINTTTRIIFVRKNVRSVHKHRHVHAVVSRHVKLALALDFFLGQVHSIQF